MIPIACTLDAGEARERWQQWQSLARTVGQVQRLTNGLSLHFPATDNTRGDLARLVGAERQCCGFVDWQLEDLGEELVLTISGEPAGVEAMVESFGLAI
jgi:hypothetical protein